MQNKNIPYISNRIPPYSEEAERAILGAILVNNALLGQINLLVSPEHFYVESLRMIYESMLDVSSKGGAVDAVTIGTNLTQKNQLERVGGALIFSKLVDSFTTTSSVESHSKIVRSMSTARRVIYAALEIANTGFGGVTDVQKYVDDSNKALIIASSNSAVGNGPQQLDETMTELYKDLENGGNGNTDAILTGIDAIDLVTGGLWNGLLTVVAGRPSMGKSSFIVNIAANISQAGKKVLYVTLEDVRKYVAMRLLARYADIDLSDITLKNVSNDSWPNIIRATKKISGKKPLWVEDTSGLSSSAIRQIVITHKMFHGVDVVIVDHLGEVKDKGANDTEIVSNATQAFRDIAKDLNIPVLLASQLNRGVESRPDHRPMLSDLKQSGKIEETARSVWFLYRPGYYEADGEDRRDLHLIVAKSNHGKTGLVKLNIDLSRMYVRGWDNTLDGDFYTGGNRQQQQVSQKETSSQGSFFDDNSPKERSGRHEY